MTRKQFEYKQINKTTGLLVLLDSLVPQSLIIKSYIVPKNTKTLVIDTAVRNKLTDMRFMQCSINSETHKPDYATHKYIKPNTDVLNLANSIMRENKDILQKSFLTKREIATF